MYGALLLAFLLCFAGEIVKAQTFNVPGNSGHNWVDTGLDIPPRALVQLSATGRVDVGAGWGVHGPEGTTDFVNGNYPYPAITDYRYGLVARLTAGRLSPHDGVKRQWAYKRKRSKFYVGSTGGHLWLTVNDDFPRDNAGEFLVSVTITRRSRKGMARQAKSKF